MMSRSKSPSPSARIHNDQGYRSSRKSPRGKSPTCRRSRSPIAHRTSPTMASSSSSQDRVVSMIPKRPTSKDGHHMRDYEHPSRPRERRLSPVQRTSLSAGDPSRAPSHWPANLYSQDSDLVPPISQERHNPGPSGPLPEARKLKMFEIQVHNPTDGNSPQDNSTHVPMEDVKIPRRFGEGQKPLFSFLLPTSRLVVFKGDPSEVKSKSDETRQLISPKSSDAPERVGRTSPSGAYHSATHRSRSGDEHIRVKSEWDREREHEREKYLDPDRLREKNGDRDLRRGESSMHFPRRTVKDRERTRQELEPYRHRDRDRERERERIRERPKEREFERGKERDRVREDDVDVNRERRHEKSSLKTEGKNEPGSSEESEEQRPRESGSIQSSSRSSGSYMDHNMPRMRGPAPGYGHMRMPPPFRPFGPFGMPPRMPPPMFPFPPRMGPRPPRY